MKTEDTVALGRQRVKLSKIKARCSCNSILQCVSEKPDRYD